MLSKIREIEKIIYSDLEIPNYQRRRSIIIDEMKQLKSHQIGCFNCDGHCCTKQSNSMKITPLEAFEILLAAAPQNLDSLKEILTKNIVEFRLDHELYTGKKHNSTLRKTYTCPFYEAGNKGCSIRIEYKPYGCLAFNPKLINDNGTNCGLNQELFTQREQLYPEVENKANQYIKSKLMLDWDKLEIPRALLSIIEKIE